MKWIFMTVALAGVVFAAAQDLPEGEGRRVIEEQCASCHSLELVVRLNQDHEKWKEVVLKMVEYGASIKEAEINAAVDYLARHFGPRETEADKTAKKFIAGICSTCHDSALITDTRATKDEWLDIVRNMNGKGAGLSEPDVELLAEYLAKSYASK